MENDGERLDEVFESPPDETQDWYFDLPQGAWERQEAKNRNLRETLLNKQSQQPQRKADPDGKKKRRWFGGGGGDTPGDAPGEGDKPRFAKLSEESREERRARLEALDSEQDGEADTWSTEPRTGDEANRPLLRRTRDDDEKSAFDSAPDPDEPVSRWDAMFGAGLKEGSIVDGMRQWATDGKVGEEEAGDSDDWDELSRDADATSMLDVLRRRRGHTGEGEATEQPAGEAEPAWESANLSAGDPAGDSHDADDSASEWAPVAADERESTVAGVPVESVAWQPDEASEPEEVLASASAWAAAEPDEDENIQDVAEARPVDDAGPETPVATDLPAGESTARKLAEIEAAWKLGQAAATEPASETQPAGAVAEDFTGEMEEAGDKEEAEVPFEVTAANLVAWPSTPAEEESEYDSEAVSPHFEEAMSASAELEDGVEAGPESARPGLLRRIFGRGSPEPGDEPAEEYEEPEGDWVPIEPTPLRPLASASEWEEAEPGPAPIEPARAEQLESPGVDSPFRVMDESGWMPVSGPETRKDLDTSWMAPEGSAARDAEAWSPPKSDTDNEEEAYDEEDPWAPFELADVENAQELPGSATLADVDTREPVADEEPVTNESAGVEVPMAAVDATMPGAGDEPSTESVFARAPDEHFDVEEPAETTAEDALAWTPGVSEVPQTTGEPVKDNTTRTDWSGETAFTKASELQPVVSTMDDQGEATASDQDGPGDTDSWDFAAALEGDAGETPMETPAEPASHVDEVPPVEVDPEAVNAPDTLPGVALEEPVDAGTEPEDTGAFDFGAALMAAEEAAEARDVPSSESSDSPATATESEPGTEGWDPIDAGLDTPVTPPEHETETRLGPLAAAAAAMTAEIAEDNAENDEEPFERPLADRAVASDAQPNEHAAGAATDDTRSEASASPWAWDHESGSAQSGTRASTPLPDDDEGETADETLETLEAPMAPSTAARSEDEEDADAWAAIADASGYDAAEEPEPPTFGRIARTPRDDDRRSWLADHFPEQEPEPDPVEEAFAQHDEEDMERDLVLRAFEAHAASDVDEPEEDPLEPGAFQELFGAEAQGIVEDMIEPRETPSFAKMRAAPQRASASSSAAFSDEDDDWAEGDDDDESLVAAAYPGDFDDAPFLAGSIKAKDPIEAKRTRTWVRELVETGLLALLVFLSVRASFQNFKVDGTSMSPTLADGQFLIVNKLIYSEVDVDKLGTYVPFVDAGEDASKHVFHGPERGDIIVLHDPGTPDQDLIKRVVALPGEKVEVFNGVVYINDQRLEEPYIKDRWGRNGTGNYPAAIVPDDTYFVMGDNRDNSKDSRSPQIGFIQEDLIIGRAELSYLPFDAFGLIGNGDPSVSEQDGRPRLTNDLRPDTSVAALTP